MPLVGYVRASVIDDNLDTQRKKLRAVGCKKIFSETKNCVGSAKQLKLVKCFDYLKRGDTLVVSRIDNLAGSLRDLQNLVQRLNELGIYLQATDQPVNTTTVGSDFFKMLAVFAEVENNYRRERQLEGIAKAKKDGKYKGRQPTAKAKSYRVIKLIEGGSTRKAAATETGIGIASVYRILKEYQENNPSAIIPGSRSNRRIATLDIIMEVENNSRFVRGKGKVRASIEYDWKYHYDMKKKSSDGWDYILKVPYESTEELEETVYEIISEASSTADCRNCFVEISIRHVETEMCW